MISGEDIASRYKSIMEGNYTDIDVKEIALSQFEIGDFLQTKELALPPDAKPKKESELDLGVAFVETGFTYDVVVGEMVIEKPWPRWVGVIAIYDKDKKKVPMDHITFCPVLSYMDGAYATIEGFSKLMPTLMTKIPLPDNQVGVVGLRIERHIRQMERK